MMTLSSVGMKNDVSNVVLDPLESGKKQKDNNKTTRKKYALYQISKVVVIRKNFF